MAHVAPVTIRIRLHDVAVGVEVTKGAPRPLRPEIRGAVPSGAGRGRAARGARGRSSSSKLGVSDGAT